MQHNQNRLFANSRSSHPEMKLVDRTDFTRSPSYSPNRDRDLLALIKSQMNVDDGSPGRSGSMASRRGSSSSRRSSVASRRSSAASRRSFNASSSTLNSSTQSFDSILAGIPAIPYSFQSSSNVDIDIINELPENESSSIRKSMATIYFLC